MEEWHITFCTVVKWLSGPTKHHQDCLISSAQSLYGPCLISVVHSLAVFWECATPPHIHQTSRYAIACDQFYQAFRRISTTIDKHWDEGMRLCIPKCLPQLNHGNDSALRLLSHVGKPKSCINSNAVKFAKTS